MLLRQSLFAVLSLQFLTVLAYASDAASLPVPVPPGDKHLHYSGRWDTRDAAGPRCAWSGGSAWISFSGTALNVVMGGRVNMVQVVVDGKPTAVLTIAPDQSVYAVASGLPAGAHIVELCKRTFVQLDVIQIKGFQLNQGATLLDLPPVTRRVEFIGDSITAGYGNEGASEKEHEAMATDNAWLTYGAIAARQLGAEMMNTSRGGIALMKFPEIKDDTLPEIWNRTLLYDPIALWDFKQWQADAVVVNLGTNDTTFALRAGNAIPQKSWSDAYLAFIAKIRTAYPKAHIFLTIGPMGHGPKNEIPGFNDAIVATCKSNGDPKVHALSFPNHFPGCPNGMGADWHPSVKTHQVMADVISAAIKQELGW